MRSITRVQAWVSTVVLALKRKLVSFYSKDYWIVFRSKISIAIAETMLLNKIYNWNSALNICNVHFLINAEYEYSTQIYGLSEFNAALHKHTDPVCAHA